MTDRTEQQRGPRLAGAEDCTGCAACAQSCPAAAIAMEPDAEGFVRPRVGENCAYCRRCEAVCPALKTPKPPRPAPDEGWTAARSSPFAALAGEMLARGGAVFGAAFSGDFRAVSHRCARTVEELSALRGAKYVQSATGDAFIRAAELLDQTIPVLWTGTPCQIAGLYAFLGGDRPGLVTCDFVCSGAPSPGVFAAFTGQITSAFDAELSSFAFDSGRGREAELHAAFRRPPEKEARGLLRFRKKERLWEWSERLSSTIYGRGLAEGLFLRPCCGSCPYGSRHPADLTLARVGGDLRRRGKPAVLTNTEKGKVLLAAVGEALGLSPLPPGEPIALPAAHSPRRAAFFQTMAEKGWQAAAVEFLSRRGPLERFLSSPEGKEKLRRMAGLDDD